MKICIIGEILARISIKNNGDTFANSSELIINYGGAEYNCAANLGYWNNDVTFISFTNDDNIAKAAISHLRSYNVKCITKNNSNNKPMGLYFYEKGSGERQGNVIYNRNDSVFANGKFDDLEIADIIKNYDCLYLSGTSLGASKKTADQLINIAELFYKNKKDVFFDINYRSKQWAIESAKQTYKKIIPFVSHLSASLWDMQNILEIKNDNLENYKNTYMNYCKECFLKYPNLKYIYSTYKRQIDSNIFSIYGLYSFLDNGLTKVESSKEFNYQNIVDRIGTGDAFSSAFVHQILNSKNNIDFDFPVQANILKNYFNGDNAKLDIELIKNISSEIQHNDVKR